jgi:hypothetical protein
MVGEPRVPRREAVRILNLCCRCAEAALSGRNRVHCEMRLAAIFVRHMTLGFTLLHNMVQPTCLV